MPDQPNTSPSSTLPPRVRTSPTTTSSLFFLNNLFDNLQSFIKEKRNNQKKSAYNFEKHTLFGLHIGITVLLKTFSIDDTPFLKIGLRDDVQKCKKPFNLAYEMGIAERLMQLLNTTLDGRNVDAADTTTNATPMGINDPVSVREVSNSTSDQYSPGDELDQLATVPDRHLVDFSDTNVAGDNVQVGSPGQRLPDGDEIDSFELSPVMIDLQTDEIELRPKLDPIGIVEESQVGNADETMRDRVEDEEVVDHVLGDIQELISEENPLHGDPNLLLAEVPVMPEYPPAAPENDGKEDGIDDTVKKTPAAKEEAQESTKEGNKGGADSERTVSCCVAGSLVAGEEGQYRRPSCMDVREEDKLWAFGEENSPTPMTEDSTEKKC